MPMSYGTLPSTWYRALVMLMSVAVEINKKMYSKYLYSELIHYHLHQRKYSWCEFHRFLVEPRELQQSWLLAEKHLIFCELGAFEKPGWPSFSELIVNCCLLWQWQANQRVHQLKVGCKQFALKVQARLSAQVIIFSSLVINLARL